MEKLAAKQFIEAGRAVLGVEFGSTRIKAVLIGPEHAPLAQGDHAWENHLVGGVWTYPLDEVKAGLQSAYRSLAEQVAAQYGARLGRLAGLGISAMMHGYLAFDANGEQLAEFRTWRNTTTEQAAAALTQAFSFNIPQRWSIAHLYQAILNGEAHVSRLAYLTTLAGYVHGLLTGERVLGVGDAAGMFPIDSETGDYDAGMLDIFASLVAEKHYPWTLRGLLPKVLPAGADAGVLTAEGAALLDPTGVLRPGAPLCPPEGDAGTGMAATNSVATRTGNVSAGTSVFAMLVLEKPLAAVYPEIDMVTTPTGAPVAMVHCNNCTSDLNAWVSLVREAAGALGAKPDTDTLYATLYQAALTGEADCGGLCAVNCYSGEPITKLDEGRPLFVRTPDAHFTLANFMRAHLYAAMAALALGMKLLTEQEHVTVESLMGHGGLFKTKGVAQKLMAGALNTPVSVMETAGEGGPWGMALLAAYRVERQPGETLESFLRDKVFAGAKGARIEPDPADVRGFSAYMTRYAAALAAERAAVAQLH